MKNRYLRYTTLALALLALTLPVEALVYASPSAQGHDPVVDCAEGVQKHGHSWDEGGPWMIGQNFMKRAKKEGHKNECVSKKLSQEEGLKFERVLAAVGKVAGGQDWACFSLQLKDGLAVRFHKSQRSVKILGRQRNQSVGHAVSRSH